MTDLQTLVRSQWLSAQATWLQRFEGIWPAVPAAHPFHLPRWPYWPKRYLRQFMSKGGDTPEVVSERCTGIVVRMSLSANAPFLYLHPHDPRSGRKSELALM
jgi:hypothetical protein